MSDTDESAVLVDTSSLLSEPDLVPESSSGAKRVSLSPDTKPQKKSAAQPAEMEMMEIKGPSSLQIVSIGSEEDKYAFNYDKNKLLAILAKVPADAKVAVVSVVGAFRTGKSFLLSWFLRYLNHIKDSPTNVAEADWYESFQSLGNDGFEWKAGAERNTMGIWMWSEPFMIGDKAVLLIDTQGMFDHETTMSLTASIFGFSTLLSSYQIYNVDKRIQEDNLQQLALFSEYARTAVGADEKDPKKGTTEKPKEKEEEAEEETNATKPKPFQHIEFLVRDWQHFDDEAEENGDCDAMEKSMEKYLDDVIANRDAKDLQETREQILSCFEKISCYGLVFPGSAVTKTKYTGDVKAMEPVFLQLLARYCSRVFDAKALEPKVIHGRDLTADQLAVYVEAYAELFASGAKFPTAETMLHATAKANNTNALHLGMAMYKQAMDRIAGPQCSNYMRQDELKKEHAKCRHEAMAKFNAIATFGNKRDIVAVRKELVREIASGFEIYESLNDGRNPLAGFEM